MFLNELAGADKGLVYFQSNTSYFQMKYQVLFLEGVDVIFSPMCFYFQSLYICYSIFSSILYIQRVTWNPGFSAYSADHVRIACICVFYFQSNIRYFQMIFPTLVYFQTKSGYFQSKIAIYFQIDSSPIFSPVCTFRRVSAVLVQITSYTE